LSTGGLSAATPLLQPSKQRGAGSARDRPYHAGLEALAEARTLRSTRTSPRGCQLSDCI